MDMDSNETTTKLLAGLVMMFLGPALFMWIWNWQFGDWYIFTYWQAFWLGMAIRLLL